MTLVLEEIATGKWTQTCYSRYLIKVDISIFSYLNYPLYGVYKSCMKIMQILMPFTSQCKNNCSVPLYYYLNPRFCVVLETFRNMKKINSKTLYSIPKVP